jgi:hypothetical protein
MVASSSLVIEIQIVRNHVIRGSHLQLQVQSDIYESQVTTRSLRFHHKLTRRCQAEFDRTSLSA